MNQICFPTQKCGSLAADHKSSSFFECSQTGECIFRRFLCDGKVDCRDKSDENYDSCGKNPCGDRIRCLNGRCIPKDFCCDPKLDHKCDKWKQAKCCDRTLEGNYNKSPFMTSLPHNNNINEQRQNNGHHNPNWGFQSAVLVISGCSLAFLLLILVISVFLTRFVMRRVNETRNRRTNCDRPSTNDSQHHNANAPPIEGRSETDVPLLVQYNNINNGVQICVSNEEQPPPYSTLPYNHGPPSYGDSFDNF